eukprot:GHRQ01035516.1.p2 GENE.GHRQ01035516.1~~GHRQ01035516.1.p2  ORF type:complete len:166 (+),score=40.56 GHRQ01035516.1:288-785(+)
MRRQGAAGLSLITMARQTLGEQGALASSAAYVFLHYALLVAYMAKAGEIVAGALGLGSVPGAALFSAAFALLCYASSQKLLDGVNSVLVGLVVASFLVRFAVALRVAECGGCAAGLVQCRCSPIKLVRRILASRCNRSAQCWRCWPCRACCRVSGRHSFFVTRWV